MPPPFTVFLEFEYCHFYIHILSSVLHTEDCVFTQVFTRISRGDSSSETFESYPDVSRKA
jgi:hypothetical protein